MVDGGLLEQGGCQKSQLAGSALRNPETRTAAAYQLLRLSTVMTGGPPPRELNDRNSVVGKKKKYHLTLEFFFSLLSNLLDMLLLVCGVSFKELSTFRVVLALVFPLQICLIFIVYYTNQIARISAASKVYTDLKLVELLFLGFIALQCHLQCFAAKMSSHIKSLLPAEHLTFKNRAVAGAHHMQIKRIDVRQ